MDAIHVRIDGDVNSVKKNKKRKKDETSDYGGEELVDEGTIKKMKTKVSSDMSEGFSDVVISTGVDKSSRKEKRKKDIISKIDSNTKDGDNRKKGKIEKGKTGDREGTKKKTKEKRKDAEFDDNVGNADDKKHNKEKDNIGDINSMKMNKKRKKNEASDYGGEELVDENTVKKMKTNGLSDISEDVSDVVISTGVDKISRKEKKKKDNIDVNTKEGDNRKEGKTGDREGTKKKTKEKRKDAKIDDNVGNADDKKRNKEKNMMDSKATSGGEDSGTRSHKRKDKSVRTELKGEVNAVASETESIGFVNDKKRKRKKRDDSGADKESRKKVHVDSMSDKSRDRGSMKNKEESLGVDAERDATPGILKHSERNETAETPENSHPNKKLKKVKFSENLEVIPYPDISNKGKGRLKNDSTEEKNGKDSSEKKEIGDDGLIRGKRFSKEEDDLIQNAVFKYIEDHQLGEEGLEMVLNCKSHPEVKHCWKEIGEALPWRPYVAVYTRAHILFERSDLRKWTQEEIELLKKFYEKHGPDWKTLGVELGKHRFHVKDAWRRYKFPDLKKGNWSQEEYEKLFSLVNMDLSMKAYTEKKLKHGMLRDNICWSTISDELATRTNSMCCKKWYDQLTSPMVADGKWANGDDYRLLIALNELDAACVEDVNWDDLLEHRSGDVCRKRWNQMVRHIGENGTKQFNEQVEILSERYCPDLLDAREDYDNRAAVD